MVRSELVRKIADANPMLSPQAADAALDAILNEITEALAQGGRVEIRGFGSFASKDRKARMGRNPRNGAPVQVAAKQVPRFRAAKRILEQLNSKN